MGFGWMFLGYTLLLKANFEFLGIPVDITPDVIGFLLMTHGFSIASRYCGCFRLTRILSIAGIPVSFLVILFDISSALKLFSLPGPVASVISYVYSFFLVIFTLCFLRSLYQITDETGLERLRKKSVRCMAYTAILFFVEHAFGDVIEMFGADPTVYKAAAVESLAGLAYVLINASLVFACYMWICLEGDEDMPDTRKHKYKTPFDYYEKRKNSSGSVHTKKKRK